jgi:hypothetical protein
MPSFVASLFNSLEERFAEIDVLLQAAGTFENTDVKLCDGICRCVVVLQAAHLEGFVRDATKAVVADLNRFSSFRHLQERTKRTFCKAFIPEDGKDANERTNRLIQLLDGLDTKLNWEIFLATTDNDGHKNATPTIIEKVFRNFGVRNVFSLLAESSLDDVFSLTNSEIEYFEARLKEHVRKNTLEFPYTIEPKQFGLDTASNTTGNSRTLWEAFVDDLMYRRHKIAHGTEVDNVDSVSGLWLVRRKVAVLQYGLLVLLCHSVSVTKASINAS